MTCTIPPTICRWLVEEGFWHNSANWGCGRVPLFYDHVLIPSGHAKVALGSNIAVCRTIEVLDGAFLSTESDATLTIVH